MTKFAETSSGPSFSRRSHLGIEKPDIFAAGGIVGRDRSRCGCRLRGVVLPASARNASWKRLKFGRSGTSVIRHLTRASNVLRTFGAALRQALLDLAADLDQHADQVRDVAARVVDVGLQQHAVARGLVELDVVMARPAGP